MPFNGAGLFVRLRNWVADAAAGVKIRADYHDLEDDGFAAGLSQCIARDGQSIVLSNIPMNGKRLTGLQDPVDPQDAATKAYADTKLPLAGGTITGGLTVTGGVSAQGYRLRRGLTGPYGNNWFNFDWKGGNVEAWIDNTFVGNMATVAYVEQRAADWAHYVADPKVNRAGDTMTGPLTVNGELVAATSYLRFGYSGSTGFIQWNGGSNYALGGGGTIWNTVNLLPILNAQLVFALDGGVGNGSIVEYPGAVVTGLAGTVPINQGLVVTYGRYRWLQLRNPNGWYTVATA